MPRFNTKALGDWILIVASLGTVLGIVLLVAVGVYTLLGTESVQRPLEAASSIRREIPGDSSGLVSSARQGELREFVETTCPACHGTHMQGSVGPPLSRTELQHLSVNAVAQTLLQGRPEKGMPPWNGQLSEADALWIAHFLKQGGVAD